MKIEVSADLINSWGEWEDGYSAEFDTLEKAVEYVSTQRLSGSPDCSMSTAFELFDDKEKLVYKGDSELLKKLFEEEKSERVFYKEHFKDRSEEDFMSYLYDVEIWQISRYDFDAFEDDNDVPIGYFEGSHKQVLDYIKALNEKADDCHYSYMFLDRLN